MYMLKLLKGRAVWTEMKIDRSSVFVGKNKNLCRIVLNDSTVSNKHLEITQDGQNYFLIDCHSKAGTSLNGQRLNADARYPLHGNDLIQLTNNVLQFVDDPDAWDRLEDEVRIIDEGSSGTLSKLDSSSRSWALRKGINPEAKLTAIIELTQSIRRCKSLEELLGKALDSLLTLFTNAYRGIVVLTDSRHKPSVTRIARYAAGAEAETTTISASVISDVVAKQTAILSDDRAAICAPLVDGDGRSLGVILLEAVAGSGRFRTDDLDILSTVAVEISFVVENSILHEAALRERKMQAELRIASQVQIGLLPSAPPHVFGYGFFDFYSPAKQVGGDYYDYLTAENGRLAIVLGDVSGKGIPAALLMAKVSSELGVFLASGLAPVEVIQRVNSRFGERAPEGAFVTMQLALLDHVSHKIVLVNAGHPPPLLRRTDGSISEVRAAEAEFPLGIDPDFIYSQMQFSLAPGESLVFYTDGVTDATNRDGEWYGSERLRSVLAATNEVAGIGQAIVEDIHTFVGDAQQVDDICLLCLHRKQSSGPADVT